MILYRHAIFIIKSTLFLFNRFIIKYSYNGATSSLYKKIDGFPGSAELPVSSSQPPSLI